MRAVFRFLSALCLVVEAATALDLQFPDRTSTISIQRPGHQRIKRDSPSPTASGVPDGRVVQVITYDDARYGFSADVSVGMPPQQVSLVLSGSNLTWLAASSVLAACESSAENSTLTCLNAKDSGAYDPEKSLSYVASGAGDQASFAYGDGAYVSKGTYGQDRITISTSKDVTLVSIITSSNFSSFPALGLGISKTHGNESLIQQMAEQNMINTMTYAANYDESMEVGWVMFGCVDTGVYDGDFLTFPFNYAGAPSINVSGIKLSENGRLTRLLDEPSSVQAEVQIGASSIWLPKPMLDPIRKILGAMYDTERGVDIVECDRLQDGDTNRSGGGFPSGLIVEIPDPSTQWTMNITVPLSLLVAPLNEKSPKTTNGKKQCFLLLRDSTPLEPDPGHRYKVVLGVPFFRAAYVVNDLSNSQTSVAPFKKQKPGMMNDNVVAIPAGVGLDSFNPRAHLPRKPLNKAAIIGGAVGGFAFACFCAILAWFVVRIYKRRKKTRAVDDSNGADAPEVLDDAAREYIYQQKGLHVYISELDGTDALHELPRSEIFEKPTDEGRDANSTTSDEITVIQVTTPTSSEDSSDDTVERSPTSRETEIQSKAGNSSTKDEIVESRASHTSDEDAEHAPSGEKMISGEETTTQKTIVSDSRGNAEVLDDNENRTVP